MPSFDVRIETKRYQESLLAWQRQFWIEQLALNNGKVESLSVTSGVSRSTIYKYLRKFGIPLSAPRTE